MANRNDHSDKKNPKAATTRQQDQERGPGKEATPAPANAQQTRDRGTVPVKDDDSESSAGENR